MFKLKWCCLLRLSRWAELSVSLGEVNCSTSDCCYRGTGAERNSRSRTGEKESIIRNIQGGCSDQLRLMSSVQRNCSGQMRAIPNVQGDCSDQLVTIPIVQGDCGSQLMYKVTVAVN